MPGLAQTSFEPVGFEDIGIERLGNLTPQQIDRLQFGVVGLAPSGEVENYNAWESRLAGIEPETVIGRPFFGEIGRCMDNHLVAHRFRDEPDLDATPDYVLTLRMKAAPVRLLRRAALRHCYLLIQR